MRAIATLFLLAIFFVQFSADNWAAEPEVTFNLLTLPASRQAQARLSMPARMNYEHAPLRGCMAQLAERFQFSYWIDRRVDADKPLSITLTDSTLGECLAGLARQCEADVGLVENVITIARPQHLASMQYVAVRLHDQLSKTAGDKGKQAQLKPLLWSDLITPRELAEQLNRQWQANVEIELPHDLMNAGQLQPCTLATQYTLLYGGFDRCVAGKQIDQLRVVAMPKAGTWSTIYPSSSINDKNVAAVRTDYPQSQLQKTGNQWTMAGSTAAHLRLLAAVPAAPAPGRNGRGSRSSDSQSGSPTADALGQQRYTISKIEKQPIRTVLTALGAQLGLDVRWDTSVTQNQMLKAVTLEARDSKLDDILAGLAQQSELEISRKEQVVEVKAR